ncbi:hypothetical protein [Streptomyces sp. NPDC096030]|uniref:hypothetical protein n=1 Tax=Streptomyces sp. NPDC096030 TaxID=3155423 RepID=UPI00331C23E5
MTTDPSEYDKAMPIVTAHLAKVERAVSRTGISHGRQSYGTVRQALVEALRDERAQDVPPSVVDELARRISEDPDMLPF